MPKIIIVNDQRCLGCKTCVLECAMAHTDARSLPEAIASGQALQSRVHVEPSGQYYGIPLQCRHCEDAPCMAVCPTEAIRRPSKDGPVLLQQERCIGCKFCLMVCPFGVIEMSPDSKAMIKCDLCIERTEAGRPPACVAGCPTGALEFVELDEHLRRRRRDAIARLAETRAKADKADEP